MVQVGTSCGKLGRGGVGGASSPGGDVGGTLWADLGGDRG